jgi:hypothetical protein
MNEIRNEPVFFPDLIKTIETNSKIQENIARFFIKDYIEKYLLLYNNIVYSNIFRYFCPYIVI